MYMPKEKKKDKTGQVVTAGAGIAGAAASASASAATSIGIGKALLALAALGGALVVIPNAVESAKKFWDDYGTYVTYGTAGVAGLYVTHKGYKLAKAIIGSTPSPPAQPPASSPASATYKVFGFALKTGAIIISTMVLLAGATWYVIYKYIPDNFTLEQEGKEEKDNPIEEFAPNEERDAPSYYDYSNEQTFLMRRRPQLQTQTRQIATTQQEPINEELKAQLMANEQKRRSSDEEDEEEDKEEKNHPPVQTLAENPSNLTLILQAAERLENRVADIQTSVDRLERNVINILGREEKEREEKKQLVENDVYEDPDFTAKDIDEHEYEAFVFLSEITGTEEEKRSKYRQYIKKFVAEQKSIIDSNTGELYNIPVSTLQQLRITNNEIIIDQNSISSEYIIVRAEEVKDRHQGSFDIDDGNIWVTSNSSTTSSGISFPSGYTLHYSERLIDNSVITVQFVFTTVSRDNNGNLIRYSLSARPSTNTNIRSTLNDFFPSQFEYKYSNDVADFGQFTDHRKRPKDNIFIKSLYLYLKVLTSIRRRFPASRDLFNRWFTSNDKYYMKYTMAEVWNAILRARQNKKAGSRRKLLSYSDDYFPPVAIHILLEKSIVTVEIEATPSQSTITYTSEPVAQIAPINFAGNRGFRSNETVLYDDEFYLDQNKNDTLIFN